MPRLQQILLSNLSIGLQLLIKLLPSLCLAEWMISTLIEIAGINPHLSITRHKTYIKSNESVIVWKMWQIVKVLREK